MKNRNNFNINSFYQDGIINLDGGLLKIVRWQEGQESSSQLKNLKIEGDSLTTQGKLTADGVNFNIENSMVIESSAALQLKDVGIKTSSLDHVGKIDYQGQFEVKTDLSNPKQVQKYAAKSIRVITLSSNRKRL